MSPLIMKPTLGFAASVMAGFPECVRKVKRKRSCCGSCRRSSWAATVWSKWLNSVSSRPLSAHRYALTELLWAQIVADGVMGLAWHTLGPSCRVKRHSAAIAADRITAFAVRTTAVHSPHPSLFFPGLCFTYHTITSKRRDTGPVWFTIKANNVDHTVHSLYRPYESTTLDTSSSFYLSSPRSAPHLRPPRRNRRSRTIPTRSTRWNSRPPLTAGKGACLSTWTRSARRIRASSPVVGYAAGGRLADFCELVGFGRRALDCTHA
ncbi:hypothetical protein V8E36_008060 [Tilletia maclaganii]